jgi:hypothetical protein
MDDYRQPHERLITREVVTAWLATSTHTAASGDAGFSDDGELPVPQVPGKPLKRRVDTVG